MMTDKWGHQAKYGTELHNILQLYFTKTGGDNYWYKNLTDPKIAGMQKTLFIKHLRDNKLISDDITDANITEVLEYAEELRSSLQA